MTRGNNQGEGLVIRPADQIECPPGIDGSKGKFRAPADDNEVGANTDYKAIQVWLKAKLRQGEKPGHSPTFLNYRKESERLLLWAWLVKGKAMSSLDSDEMLEYADFITHPGADWISKRVYKRDNPRWRPFRGPVTGQSQQYALNVLRSMFTYLTERGYLRKNALRDPIKVSQKDKHKKLKGPDRHLKTGAWALAVRRLEIAISEAATDREWHSLIRERWVVMLLVYTGLRREEAAEAMMCDVVSEEFKSNGHLTWWLGVTGKGNKERRIPLPEIFLSELADYRQNIGLPAQVVPGEKFPLVARLGHSGRPIVDESEDAKKHVSTTVIYECVKRFFTRAAEYANSKKASADEQQFGGDLKKASTHWIRHTYLTRLVAMDVPLLHAQQNAGHSDLNTTKKYLHVEDAERAASIEVLNDLNRRG